MSVALEVIDMSTRGVRRHRCEVCGRIFECEECSASLSQDEGILWSARHQHATHKWMDRLVLVCPRCEAKEKSA